MLDMLKFNGGAAQRTQEQAGALHLLVQRASQERAALHAVLDVLAVRGANILPLGRQVQDATEQATAVRERLDELTGRLAVLDGRSRDLDTIESRIQSLTDATSRAEQRARDAVGPDSEIQKHRLILEQVSAQTKQLHSSGQTAEQRLRALNALSEQITQKTKALEHQQQIVEHAVIQSNRVAEMVWAMDAQLSTLTEGLQRVTKAEETIERIERLAHDTAVQFKATTEARQDAERDLTTFKKDAQGLIDKVVEHIASLDVRRAEFDTFDTRARGLQDAMAHTESRITALAETDKQIASVTRQAELVTARVEVLTTQTEEFARKQTALEGMRGQLTQLSDLAANASRQMESLQQHQAHLATLKQDLKELTVTHATVSKLRDGLQTEREKLEAFGHKMGEMSTRTALLDAKMDTVLGRLSLVDEGAHKAAELGRQVTVLDGQLDGLEKRAPILANVEGRLGRLDEVSAAVDTRLNDQLARRTDVDALKTVCDEVLERASDAQHRLEVVRAAQARLTPLVADVDRLTKDIEQAKTTVEALTSNKSLVLEQEKRFSDLLSASRDVANEVGERVREMQRLGDELNKAGQVKGELLTALDTVQARQRDAVEQVAATEAQLARTEEALTRLEQRNDKATLSETTLAVVESRFLDIARLGDEVERSARTIAERAPQVNAVKAEVDAIHALCARSRSDLTHVTEHRADVTSLRHSVDTVLSRIGDTDARIATLDAHGKVIDEVREKAEAVATLLDDVRGAFDLLAEQREVVNQVADKVAGLESLVHNAQTVVERATRQPDLSSRLARKVKSLKVKSRPKGSVTTRETSNTQERPRMALVG